MSRARDAVRFHCRVHHRAGITSIVGISMAGDRSEFVPIPDNFFTGKDCRNVTKICSHSRSCRSFLVCHTEVWNYVVFKFLYFTLPEERKNGDKEMMNESHVKKILVEIDRNCFIIYHIFTVIRIFEFKFPALFSREKSR